MNLRDLFLRIRALVARHRVERELDEEPAFHIERELLHGLPGDTPVAGYVVINSWLRSWFERLIEFERLRMERSTIAPGEVARMVAKLRTRR